MKSRFWEIMGIIGAVVFVVSMSLIAGSAHFCGKMTTVAWVGVGFLAADLAGALVYILLDTKFARKARTLH